MPSFGLFDRITTNTSPGSYVEQKPRGSVELVFYRLRDAHLSVLFRSAERISVVTPNAYRGTQAFLLFQHCP